MTRALLSGDVTQFVEKETEYPPASVGAPVPSEFARSFVIASKRAESKCCASFSASSFTARGNCSSINLPSSAADVVRIALTREGDLIQSQKSAVSET